MKRYQLLLLSLLFLPSLLFGSSLEYGIKVRNANSEFGTSIPKELCLKEQRSPCRLPVYKLYNVVSDIENTKNKLSSAGYSALKRHSVDAQVVWEFNLCKPFWDKQQPCVETLGYLVVKSNKVSFYVFQLD